MVKLFLVQHGEAKSGSEHPDRPLTEGGAATVGRMAAWAKGVGLEVDEIRHSGKRRAEETAAILGEHLQPGGGVVTVSGLKPKDDVAPLAAALEGERRSVMLVGHLPHLAGLAALLVVGDPERPVVRFHNGGIVCLARAEAGWSAEWIVTPEIVP